MVNPIVQTNVNQITAPAPSTLQRTGAIISQGATTLSANAKSLVVSSELPSFLSAPAAITSITWLSSVATVTTAAAHGLPNGDVINVTIAGAIPAGYNGTFAATVTGASTFTYPLVSNPGSETTPGTWIVADVAELTSQLNTWWSQGSQLSVYVLELGPGAPARGITALGAYISANPGVFYAFLVPSEWDGVSGYLALVAEYETTTSKLYFFTQTTTGTYTDYTAQMKCVFAMVPAAAAPSTEFTTAWPFRSFLNYNPSSTNKVTPFCYNFGYGVTAWPSTGDGAQLTTFQNYGTNFGYPGSEGGLSNVTLRDGTFMDGNDATYWYSVDWVQINLDLNTSNAVENGSNNSSNPLYYNQDGINRLQRVGLTTLSNGVAYGLILNGNTIQTQLSQSDWITALESGAYDGMTVINAVPFLLYTAANPSDYAAGLYAGLSVAYVPARGFKHIVYTVNVSNLVNA